MTSCFDLHFCVGHLPTVMLAPSLLIVHVLYAGHTCTYMYVYTYMIVNMIIRTHTMYIRTYMDMKVHVNSIHVYTRTVWIYIL